jgi:RimJ/RimL family protein N-acetyltransferase
MLEQVILGIETDKAGNSLTVYKSKQLGMSPAYSFFIKSFAETVDLGFAYPVTTWDDKRCSVIYVTVKDEIVGQITYDTDSPMAPGFLWIVLSSVKSSYRGQGIYKLMHKYIDQIGKDGKYEGVVSYVHVDNQAQLRALESVDKKPIFYLAGKKL